MISRLIRWFPGWVRVRTEGGYPERLLNAIAEAGIEVWRVHRRGEEMHFSCRAGEYRCLYPMARRSCVRMRMVHKRGFPFWCRRYRHRKGLWVAAVLYIAILLALSPRIWVIEVEGNTTTSTAAVRELAEQYGVRIGARMNRLDIKGLQFHGPDRLTTVSFITVNPSYNVARIQVTERDPTPQVVDLSRPSDLVAVRDGKILQVDARSGKPLVKVGEAVTAGTVLITGHVDTDLGPKLYRAYGEVWAETTRRITVSVPLVQVDSVPTERALCRPTFSFLCWDLPLYSTRPLQGEMVSVSKEYPFVIRDTVLPLRLTCDYYFPLVSRRTIRTTAQAREQAQAQLAEQEAALFLPDSFQRLGETGRVQGDAYVLTATYRCRENIATEVPLG